MTFKSFLFITTLFWGTSFTIDNPTVITWRTLSDVSFEKKWNQDEGMFILIPEFVCP